MIFLAKVPLALAMLLFAWFLGPVWVYLSTWIGQVPQSVEKLRSLSHIVGFCVAAMSPAAAFWMFSDAIGYSPYLSVVAFHLMALFIVISCWQIGRFIRQEICRYDLLTADIERAALISSLMGAGSIAIGFVPRFLSA